jgi:ABC-2 type transport system ATP-binding protein
MSNAEARSGADAVAERLGLTSQMAERTAHLSHGWKQRLAVAAALVHQPRLLLLDEATAGIDPTARADFWEILTGYARSGATILFSSHYTDETTRCDRVGNLTGGVLQ